jgi:hypothetical protein
VETEETARLAVRKPYWLPELKTVMALHLFNSDFLFDGASLSTAFEKLLLSRKSAAILISTDPLQTTAA